MDDVRATAHAAVTLCDRFEAMAAVSRSEQDEVARCCGARKGRYRAERPVRAER